MGTEAREWWPKALTPLTIVTPGIRPPEPLLTIAVVRFEWPIIFSIAKLLSGILAFSPTQSRGDRTAVPSPGLEPQVV